MSRTAVSAGEQIQREPRLPTGRLRDGETRSTPNEIDRKVQPRRFAMGEKEVSLRFYNDGDN